MPENGDLPHPAVHAGQQTRTAAHARCINKARS